MIPRNHTRDELLTRKKEAVQMLDTILLPGMNLEEDGPSTVAYYL